MQVVVREVLLDHVALEAQADDEFVDPVGGVDLHDVPKDRLASDFHHRLRAHLRFLAYARAKTSSENHSLHLLAEIACVAFDHKRFIRRSREWKASLWGLPLRTMKRSVTPMK